MPNEEPKQLKKEQPKKRQSKKESKEERRVQFKNAADSFFGRTQSETLETLESSAKDPRKEILKEVKKIDREFPHIEKRKPILILEVTESELRPEAQKFLEQAKKT